MAKLPSNNVIFLSTTFKKITFYQMFCLNRKNCNEKKNDWLKIQL
jgi:hypothetical protein